MSRKRTLTPGEVCAILESLLAAPPSRAGRRLCSERELATRFGVDRMKIQRAFDQLVERGILRRKQGSGTYLRKVPRLADGPVASAAPGRATVGARTVVSEDLFATPLRRETRGLKLAIVPNARWESESNRSIFKGIRDRIHAEGHRPTVIECGEGDDLAAKLRESRCDGVVLWSGDASAFEAAFGTALGGDGAHTPAVVFIGSGEREADLSCAPLVRIGLEDALLRALRQLHREGHERIGLIGFRSPERGWKSEAALYDGAMAALGLRFRSVAHFPLDAGTVEREVNAIFTSPDRPEAVYIADDIVLRHVAAAWRKMGIVAGKDVAVITLSSTGNPLPARTAWSCMRFDPYQVGRMAVDSLLQEMETAGATLCSFEHLAVWQPGNTHQTHRK